MNIYAFALGKFCMDNNRPHKYFLKVLLLLVINNRVLIVKIQGIASVVCKVAVI